MIRFACGTCKERLVVPDRHAGRKGKCPKCGTINRVPPVSELGEPVQGGETGAAGVGRIYAPGGEWETVATSPIKKPEPAVTTTVQVVQVVSPAAASVAGPAASPREPVTASPRPPAPAASPDPPPAYVNVNPLDDVGMPGWVKLLAVVGILAILVLGVWVVFYLLIWSRMKLAS